MAVQERFFALGVGKLTDRSSERHIQRAIDRAGFVAAPSFPIARR
jgi:hypothetical protein